MSAHAIKVTIREGGPLCAEFICNADDHAECHYYCPLDSCEEGCMFPAQHRPGYEHFKQCGMVTWLEEGGTWDEQYEGPDAELRSGPIEMVWQGDYYTWRYAEVPA